MHTATLQLTGLAFAQINGETLPPTTRAIAMMALLAIALLGLFLIALVLLGGNWVRRLGKHRRGRPVPPDRAPLRRQQQPPPEQPQPGLAESAAIEDTVADATNRKTMAD